MLMDKKVGFIGGGRMAEAIFSGLLASKTVPPEQVYITDIVDERLDFLKEKYGVNIVKNTKKGTNQGSIDLLEQVDVVLLATKPQAARDLLSDIAEVIDEKGVIALSIMGGITLEYLEQFIQKSPVIRIMPNTPMLVQEGVAGIALGKNASTEDGDIAVQMFRAVGLAYVMPENMIDPLTSVSGCGPAYAAMFIQALADGGVEMGLPRAMAVELAAKTLVGTGKMVLETGEHPEILKDNVCTPAGGTIAGVRALEEGKFRGVVMSAVESGMKRMIEVGKKA